MLSIFVSTIDMLRAVGFLELQFVFFILGAAFLQGGYLISVENLFVSCEHSITM